MQARTVDRTAEIASLLESFGMDLSVGGLVVMSDFAKAESAYVHHSRVPVAVVAMALASPTVARGRFPKLRLVDVVVKAPVMDDEQCACRWTGWPDKCRGGSDSGNGFPRARYQHGEVRCIVSEIWPACPCAGTLGETDMRRVGFAFNGKRAVAQMWFRRPDRVSAPASSAS
jgi:hypothetical protein